RLSKGDDDGVTFKSHLDGAMHRFTPEISMRVQHEIGADIMFAFDELTTLINTRGYQEESLERTRHCAIRCVEEHFRLTEARSHRRDQALFGELQGAQYEYLRRKADRDPRGKDFDGFGIGGALWKDKLCRLLPWSCRRTSRGTCWASPSPMPCSRRSGPERTPSTASRPHGWPAMPRSTPVTGASTSPGRNTAGTSDRSIPTARATPVRTIRGPIC